MAYKTKKRINLSVSEEMEKALSALAKRDDVPVATKTLELLKEALVVEEDIVLGEMAEKRDIKNVKYVKHENAWK
ncbi:MAG: hypothetical protein WDZ40_04045 [Candidatus Spechtbacterales bacterium]